MRVWAILFIGLLAGGAAPQGDPCNRVDCGVWDIPASSQPPAPGSGKGQTKQEGTTKEVHGDAERDENATAISASTPEVHRNIGTKPEQEGKWYTNPDWWVAIFTGLLFFATSGLWVFTALLWSSTKRAVDDGNDALRLARSEFLVSHRPRLVLREAASGFNDPEDATIFVEYVIANIGGSACWITESNVGIELVPEIKYPAFLLTPDKSYPIHCGSIGKIKPGERRRLPFVDPKQRWTNEYRDGFPSPGGVHFVGHIAYVDEAGSGITRHMAFRRRFDVESQRFRPIPGIGDEHEYVD